MYNNMDNQIKIKRLNPKTAMKSITNMEHLLKEGIKSKTVKLPNRAATTSANALSKTKQPKSQGIKSQISVKTEDIRPLRQKVIERKQKDLQLHNDIIEHQRQQTYSYEYDRLKSQLNNTLTGVADKDRYKDKMSSIISQLKPDYETDVELKNNLLQTAREKRRQYYLKRRERERAHEEANPESAIPRRPAGRPPKGSGKGSGARSSTS
jgi:hypothetical protein